MELTGYSSEEFLGKYLWEIGLFKNIEAAKISFSELQAKEYIRYDNLPLEARDGRMIEVEFVSNVYDVDNKSVIQCNIRDITERKQAERRAEQEIRNLARFPTENPNPVLRIGRDGILLYVNKASYLLLSDWQLEVGQPAPEALQAMASEGLTRQIGLTLDIKLAQKIISFTIAPIVEAGYTNLYGNDITERRLAEDALANEKERLAVTLKSIGDAVIATDKNGKILIFNNIAEQLTGWMEYEAIGKQLTDVFIIINEETRKPLANPVGNVLEQNKIIDLAGNSILIAKDGTEKIIANSGAPIKNKAGDVIGVVLVFKDVTKTKQMQEFISSAQRLETAGRISGQIAHDFNNLLGPLVAYPEFIKERIPSDHPARQYVDKMESAATQMADINQQLLTLSRRGHYNQEPLNLNPIVNQAVDQTCQANDKLHIELNLDIELMNVKGGGSQIYRAIANIISNAQDAMNQAGKLTIKTENFYADQISEKFGRVPKGEYIKLTISDTGEGIKENIQAKIFEPFFTTKAADRKKGSGLGLSVVHTVMEDHNGYVDLQSADGKGTSFYLYFPMTRESISGSDPEDVVGGKEKILIVDDDIMQREVSMELLGKLGYNVCAVDCGEAAIDHVRRNKPDLLVLDMIMPDGMDGTETYRKILELNPVQKAIIVSGYADMARVEEALELGAGSCVRKPLTLKTIAPAVRKELDRRAVIA